MTLMSTINFSLHEICISILFVFTFYELNMIPRFVDWKFRDCQMTWVDGMD